MGTFPLWPGAYWFNPEPKRRSNPVNGEELKTDTRNSYHHHHQHIVSGDLERWVTDLLQEVKRELIEMIQDRELQRLAPWEDHVQILIQTKIPVRTFL